MRLLSGVMCAVAYLSIEAFTASTVKQTINNLLDNSAAITTGWPKKMVSKMLEKLEKIPDKAEDMLENVEDIVQQVNDVLHELPESAENMFQAKISNHQEDGGVSCRDEDGNPVDWWILYKLPQPKKDKADKYRTADFISNGTAYTYLLPNKDTAWTLSSRSIEDPLSMAGQTLAPLYTSRPGDEMVRVLYNDELPDGPTSFNLGHTKGVLFGDEKSSVWLIHSVPHYPPYPNTTYGYPRTGHRYGQSFICLSLPTATSLEKVGEQLSYNQPFLYGVNLPTWADQYQALKMAAKGGHIKVAPYYHSVALETAGGVKLTSFAKYSKFGKDLYADLVAPALMTPLLVETWPNGPGRMPSRCSGTPFIVENVREIEFPGVPREDFSTRHDHSKWAISLDPKKPVVCIGDINRMETQKKRGGGTACFEDRQVWKTFKTTIKDIEPCPRNNL